MNAMKRRVKVRSRCIACYAAIVLILLVIGFSIQVRSNETRMKTSLFVLRMAIDEYASTNRRYRRRCRMWWAKVTCDGFRSTSLQGTTRLGESS